MSAPLLFVLLPLVVAVGLYFARARRWLVVMLAGIVCFSLAAIALLMPIDRLVQIGPISFRVPSTLLVLGRRLVLEDGHRTFLAFTYTTAGFWFLGTLIARANRLFVPMGLAMVSLLVAVSAVEPFLYAALLVEMAVLVSLPFLAPPGKPFGQGVLRYLIFQSLAMPFILLAGWSLASIEANPSNQVLYGQAEIFLGLGFAFWLAVFPFYTWIPLLTEQSHPYTAGFVVTLLFSVILLFSLNFLDTFAWLRSSALLFQSLRLVGLIMVGTAGIWAAFQRNQARLMGYAVILELGISLLALSLGIGEGLKLFAQLFLPRIIALATWALALAILQRQPDFRGFSDLRGQLRRAPVAGITWILAYFSLGALPLLAGFPVRMVVMETLASQSIGAPLWVMAGNMGYLIGGLRALALMAAGDEPWRISETRTQITMLVIGALALILIGLFPGAFIPGLNGLLDPFTRLR